MSTSTATSLAAAIDLARRLEAGRGTMLEPQDLPGRFGRVIRSIDRVLKATGTEAVLAGGWAVWRHGYAARVTQDLDIAMPADRVQEFIRVASLSGFELLTGPPGRWPKLVHKDTKTRVDLLPEGARPGTAARPAPTTIPHPSAMGAEAGRLRYIRLPSLVELKLAAGRGRDEADVIELIRCDPSACDDVRQHLAGVHPDYVQAFDRLVERAREEEDR